TWQKLFRVESGDIVFSNIKAWEGAFAVARPEHHGKVGSHRYLTCVAEPSRASPDFIWYYLQCPEGLAQVEAASPGSADRNRTLAQDRLGGIMLPLPSMDAQHWFDARQQKAAEVRKAQAANDYDLNTVLLAMLGRLFNGA